MSPTLVVLPTSGMKAGKTASCLEASSLPPTAINLVLVVLGLLHEFNSTTVLLLFEQLAFVEL